MSWQVKKDGAVKAYGNGEIPYSAETLKQMRSAGYKIYVDGKAWKK
jgi:hypothetical protein